jgi:hypothetical protein
MANEQSVAAIDKYEQELADYLQERIKPGLNRGAIPLLARSIAKEIAHREAPDGAPEDADADDPPSAEADEEAGAEEDDQQDIDEDEPSAEGETPSDFEADMHELQAELGDDWILRFSVQGDGAWLTAEKDDGSQRVEAPTASVLADVVGLLYASGGRSA